MKGNPNVRPTKSVVFESIANSISHRYNLPDCRFLDLFSGTGNVGLAFLEKNMREVHAVDINFARLKQHQNLTLYKEKLTLFRKTAETFLQKTKQKYDIIFADPPYTYTPKRYEKIVGIIFARKLLNPKGTLIIEHRTGIYLKYENENIEFQTRKYGSTTLSFYTKKS